MQRKLYSNLICLVFLAILAACAAPQTASPVVDLPVERTQGPTSQSPTVATAAPEPTTAPAFKGESLAFDRDDMFAAAGICTGCHAVMLDETGKDVSIDRMWRASMMANAARDPYWLAAVRSEVLDAPELRDVIEDKCATCHMPMASTSIHAKGDKAAVLDGGLLANKSQGHGLAMDGVSCNLCHQIDPQNFGQPESFSGQYLIDFNRPKGERVSYGPFDVDQKLTSSMKGGSGFIPVKSDHLAQSELCATCHTLYTPYLDGEGKVAGEFPEQTPYQEWSNSQYVNSISCQDCHMPKATGGVQLSILPGPKRSPFFQHDFAGGNAYILRMLRNFGEDLGVTASSKNFDDAILSAEKILQTGAAALKLSELRIDNGLLVGQVQVQNLTGHKLPTAYPSRRTWLHVTVRDSAGNVVFESGAYHPDGSIVENDNDADPAKFEPHYTVLDSPDQVQIYETIMVNTESQVTTRLLRGAAYIKDNRLLPLGFEKAAVVADIAVYGEALGDADFGSGGDVLALAIPIDGINSPYTMYVELLYQSIGYRWAQNLAQYQEEAEITTFLGFYNALSNLQVMITSAQGEVK